MGHSSATTMLQEIVTLLHDHEIDVTKVIQMSMDGPNVNWKLHRLLMEHVAAADAMLRSCLTLAHAACM